jgi:hypothetical protein
MAADMVGIYGGGPLYTGGQSVIDDLRASGFTTIIAWALHVSSAGDLSFNDTKIVSNGEYVGDPEWPGLLAGLESPPTSVNRLLFSVGGWGVDDFQNIQQLMNSQGTGPNSILYRNFQALKSTIPAVDAIDFDDESLYDGQTTTRFSMLLHELGLNVTFCPYTEQDFWTACLKKLNTGVPGLVQAFNLQCYAGGEGNTPGPWIDAVQQAMGPDFDAAGFVFPGLWCSNGDGCQEGQCPDSIESTIAGWSDTHIQGGWIWLLDDVYKCENSAVCSGPMGTAAYAQAIVSGLGGGAP